MSPRISLVTLLNLENEIKVGASFKKGDMLGYFLFGGSDYVILFQDKVKFTLTVPKDKDGHYNHLLMGEQYGKVSVRR